MGEDQAPWQVGWYYPDGRRHMQSCGPGAHGKRRVEKLKRKIEVELMTGTYAMHVKKLWHDFRKEYDERILRDERVKLHPAVVEHLKRLPGFTPTVLPWPHNIRTLYVEFARIQKAAGIDLPGPDQHEHTPACHLYGFHDLLRAFATMNADKLTPDALQTLMRHKSYLTTQLYINMARQMDEAVAELHVPDVLKKGPAAAG
jgi:integrase